MSATGISGKPSGDKNASGKSKFNALNINNVFSGKSLVNPKTNTTSKHGLQSLGKSSVVVRRMPPPANLPSIKSQIEPDVNLVPTGGQGWGSQASNNEQSALNQQQVAAANVNQGANLQKVSTAPSNIATGPQAGQAGGWKTSDVQEPPSSYNARDFPHLVGDGDGATRGSQRGMQQSSSQPSLRPQNVASWKTGGGRNIPHTEMEEEEEEQQPVQQRTGAQRAPEDRSPSMMKDRDRSPSSQDQGYRPPSASHPGFMPPPPFGMPPPRGFQPPFPYHHQHPPYPYPPPMPPMPPQQRAPAPQKGFPPTSSRFQPGYSGNRRAPPTESNDDNDRNRERPASYMPQRHDRVNGDNYDNRVVWSDDEHGGEDERTRKSPRYRNQRGYAAAPTPQHHEPGYYSDEDMYHQQDRGHRDRNYYRDYQMPPPIPPPQGYQMPPMPPNWYPPPYPPPGVQSEQGSDRPMQPPPPMHGMMRPPPLLGGPPPPRQPYAPPARVDDDDEDAMQARQQLTKREQAIGRSSRRRLAQQTSMSSDHDLAPSEHGSDDVDRPESHEGYAKSYHQSNRRPPQHQQQQAPRFQRSGHMHHAEQAANYPDSGYRSELYPPSEGYHDRQSGGGNRRRERDFQNQSDSHHQYQAADDSKRLSGSDRSANNVVESEIPYDADEIHRQVLKRPESRDSTTSERSSIRGSETRSRAGTGHDRIPVVVEEPPRRPDVRDIGLEKQMANMHIEAVVIEEEEIIMEKLDKPKVVRRSVDTNASNAASSADAVAVDTTSFEKSTDGKHKGEDLKSNKKSNEMTSASDLANLKPAPEPAVNVWAQRQAERASQDRETGWPSVAEENPVIWNFDHDEEFKGQDSEWIEEDEYSKSTKRVREQQPHRPQRGRSVSNRGMSHRGAERGGASYAVPKAQRNAGPTDYGASWGAPKNQRGGVGTSSSQPGRRKREHEGDESGGKLVIGEWHNEEAGDSADASKKQDNKGHDSDRQHSPESHKELKGAGGGPHAERGRRRGGSHAAATANNRRSTSAFDNEWDSNAYSGGYNQRSRGFSSSAVRGGRGRGRSNYSIPPLFGASRRGGYNNSYNNSNRDYYNYYYDYNNYEYEDGENQHRGGRGQVAKERPRKTVGAKKSAGMGTAKKHSNSATAESKESGQRQQAAAQSSGNVEAAKSPATSDYADDWETASESSGVGDRGKHPHASGNDFPMDGKGRPENNQSSAATAGKSFSRQRPTRRGGSGNAQNQHMSGPKNVKAASHQVADYHQKRSSQRNDIRGGSIEKSAATATERPDALAQVDINNIAGVFVIDDQPDAAHLEVFDDGFQLVSRKKPKKESEDPRSRSNSRSKPQKTRSEKLSSGIGRSNTKQQTQPTNRSSSRQIPPQQQPAISTPDKEIKSENQNSTKTVSAASRPTVTFTNSSYFSSNEVPPMAVQVPNNSEPAVTGWDVPIPSGLPGISFGSFGSPSASLSSLPSKTGVEIWGTPDPAPAGLLKNDQSKPQMDSRTDLESGVNLDSQKPTKDFQSRVDLGSANQSSSNIQLEFTYEETTVSNAALQSNKADTRGNVVKQSDSVSPDDLNQKIAAVKNVWDRDDHSQSQQNSNAVGSLFTSSDMEQESSHAGGAEKTVAREMAKNDSTACYASNNKDSNQGSIQMERSYPSNVAKVRPQPQQIPQAAVITPIGSAKDALFGNAVNLNFQSSYGLQHQATLPSPIHAVSNVASLFAQTPLMKQENAPMQLSGYATATPSNVGGFIVPSMDRPMSASSAGANWPLPPQAVSNQQNGAFMMGQPAVAVNSASVHSSVGFGRPPSNPAAVPAVGSMFMMPLIDTSQPPPPIMNFSQPPLPPAPLMGPSLLPHGPGQANAAALSIQSIPSKPGNFMMAHGTQPMPPQAQFATPAPVAPFVNHPPGPIQPPIGTQPSFGGAKWHEGGSQAPGFGRKGSRNASLATSSSPNQQGSLLGPAPGSQKFQAPGPMLNVIQPIAPTGTIGIGNVPGFGVPPQLFDRSGGMNVSNGRAAAAAAGAAATAPSFGYSHTRSSYYKQDQRRDKDLLQDIDRFLNSGGESAVNDDQTLN